MKSTINIVRFPKVNINKSDTNVTIVNLNDFCVIPHEDYYSCTTKEENEFINSKICDKEYTNMLKLINVNNGEYVLKYASSGIEFADVFSLGVNEETGEKCINVAHKMDDLSDIQL